MARVELPETCGHLVLNPPRGPVFSVRRHSDVARDVVTAPGETDGDHVSFRDTGCAHFDEDEAAELDFGDTFFWGNLQLVIGCPVPAPAAHSEGQHSNDYVICSLIGVPHSERAVCVRYLPPFSIAACTKCRSDARFAPVPASTLSSGDLTLGTAPPPQRVFPSWIAVNTGYHAVDGVLAAVRAYFDIYINFISPNLLARHGWHK